MITAKTLVGLACLLSQAGPGDNAALKKSLTEMEKTHLEALMSKEPCLPESFESLLKETEDKIKSGEIPFSEQLSSPTRDCLSL